MRIELYRESASNPPSFCRVLYQNKYGPEYAWSSGEKRFNIDDCIMYRMPQNMFGYVVASHKPNDLRIYIDLEGPYA